MATQTLDSAAPEKQPSPIAMATPHLVLIGYGVTDTLQITVEAQRLLARYGSAYSLGLPANLAAFLKSQRVKVTDIASRTPVMNAKANMPVHELSGQESGLSTS